MGWQRMAFLHDSVMIHTSRLLFSSGNRPPRTGQVYVLILLEFFLRGWVFENSEVTVYFSGFSEHCKCFIPNNVQVPLGQVRCMQSLACACVYVFCDIRSFGAAAAISVNGLKPFTSSWEYTPANCVPAIPWDLCENDASKERRFQWYSALG